MCSRNEDCAKCSTFEGKSLAECKNDGRCEVNVLEVEVVSDITKKTGKNFHIAHNVPMNFPLKSRLLKQISTYLNSLLKCSLFQAQNRVLISCFIGKSENLDSNVLFDRRRRFRHVHSFPFCDK